MLEKKGQSFYGQVCLYVGWAGGSARDVDAIGLSLLLTQEIKGKICVGAAYLFIHSICCLLTSLAYYRNFKQDTKLRPCTRSWKQYTLEIMEDDEDKNVFYMHSFQIIVGHLLCVSCSTPPLTWFLLFINRLDQVSVYYSRLQSICRFSCQAGIVPEECIISCTNLPMTQDSWSREILRTSSWLMFY